MYGDRRLVKDREIKTRGDEYLMQRLDEYIRRTGKQRHVVLRQWIEEGIQRDLEELELKNNTSTAASR